MKINKDLVLASSMDCLDSVIDLIEKGADPFFNSLEPLEAVILNNSKKVFSFYLQKGYYSRIGFAQLIDLFQKAIAFSDFAEWLQPILQEQFEKEKKAALELNGYSLLFEEKLQNLEKIEIPSNINLEELLEASIRTDSYTLAYYLIDRKVDPTKAILTAAILGKSKFIYSLYLKDLSLFDNLFSMTKKKL